MTIDPEVEDDFNKWYNEIHLPEVCTWPGFVRGARYVSRTDTNAETELKERHYLAVYELTGPEAINDDFQRRRGWAQFKPYVTGRGVLFQRIGQAEAPKEDGA